MRGSDAVTRVSQFLADQFPGDEFARWSRDELFNAFRYALQQIALVRPNTFNGTVDVTLQEGALQYLPSCCGRLTDTVDNLRPVTRLAQRLVSRKVVCPKNANDAYKPTSYVYDADRGQNLLYISPPVPASAVGGTLKVVCDKIPDPSSLDDDVEMTGPVEGCVIDLMLFYICSAENESVTQANTSRAHFNSAMRFLGIDVQNDERDYRRKVEEVRSGITG